MRFPSHAVVASLAAISALAGCTDADPAGPDEPGHPEPRADRINPDPVPQSVRFVWFVPADVAFDEATVDAIRRAAYNTRSWYRAQMDGTTFTIDEDFPVEVVFGEHRRSWYESQPNPFGWDPIWNANYWVDMEVIERLSLVDWSPLYKVAIYMSAEGAGGASQGRLVIPQHDVDGIQDGTPNINRWWGGLAHELGHTFDLPDANGDDGTIMSGALYAYPGTYLSDTQTDDLLGSDRNTGFFTDRGLAFDPDAHYRLVNVGTGRVADLQTDEAVDGVPVVGSEAGVAESQHWSLEAGPSGTWRIWNGATEKLLVVEDRSSANGAGIEQQSGGDPAYQSWYVLGTGPDEYEIIAAHTIVANERVKALTASDDAAEGGPLTQEDYVAGERQTWRLERVE